MSGSASRAEAASRSPGREEPHSLARGRVWVGLALLLVVGLVNVLGFCSSNQIEDDAFIFFRYADNLLHGHGLTWNPGGERVEGYSSFLYVMCIVLLRAAGTDPVAAAHTLNVLLFLGTIALSVWLLRVLTGQWSRAGLLAAGAIASSAQLATFARNGMETALFAFLIVLALALYLRDGKRRIDAVLSGVVFGLVALTRPEGALVYVVCLGRTLLDRKRRAVPLVDRSELVRLGALLAVVVPHLAWRLAYYGDLVPNTYHAKVSWRPGLVGRGFGGFVAFLGTLRGSLLAIAVTLWALLPKRAVGSLLVALTAVWVGYLTLALGLPHWWYWYAMPVDLFTLLLLGTSLAQHFDAAASGASRTRTAWVVGLVLLALGNLSGAIQRHQQSGGPFRLALIDPPDRATVNGFITIGKKMREIARPGESMAVGACGAIPYYAGLETFDVLGLNDKHIARTKVTGPLTDAFGHEKGDGAYILGKRPTYLIPLPVLTPQPSTRPSGFEKSFNEIYQMQEFRRDYEPKNVEISKGQFFNYFQRRTAPLPGDAPSAP